MWPFNNKKEDVKKESKKISNSFKRRDKRISNIEIGVNKIQEDIKELKNNIVSRKEFDVLIKLIQYGQNTKQEFGLKIGKTKEDELERAMITKVKKTRPELIKRGIRTLLEEDMRTTDIYNSLVLNKKMCRKTQFYHYLGIVRSELRTRLRTELQTRGS